LGSKYDSLFGSRHTINTLLIDFELSAGRFYKTNAIGRQWGARPFCLDYFLRLQPALDKAGFEAVVGRASEIIGPTILRAAFFCGIFCWHSPWSLVPCGEEILRRRKKFLHGKGRIGHFLRMSLPKG
jgi:hypothetical protein